MIIEDVVNEQSACEYITMKKDCIKSDNCVWDGSMCAQVQRTPVSLIYVFNGMQNNATLVFNSQCV